MFSSRTFVISLIFISSQVFTTFAAPATGPSGENSAGKFSEYFQNAVDNPCDADSYMAGFLTSPYMEPDCRLFPSSFRAWLLIGNISSPTDFIGTINNEALRIRTNNTERMIVTAGGDVGIGTNTPLAKLQVVGDAFIQGTIINSDAIEVGENRTGNRYSYIDFHGDDTYTDFGLRVLRGNAGPNSWSEIYHAGTGDFNVGTLQAAPISFRTSSAERMRIQPNGNVGIGTSSPEEKLQVVGNTLTNNILTQIGNGNGLCFWSDCTNYKIAMGNPADYQYGPVTDYSIKNIIGGGAGRGFTWGRAGVVPVASINATTGNMQIDGTFDAGGIITAPAFVGNLTGNASTATNASAVPWSGVTGKPTTISGITGADSIGANPNTRLNSGFYEQSNAQMANGWPESTSSWWHLISSTHSNTGNYYAMQFAASFFENKLYYRSTNGTGSTAWGRVPLADGGTYGLNISGNSNYATTAGSISGFNNPTTAATANTIVYRDAGGHTYANYSFANYFNAAAGNSENPAITQIWTQNNDNYLRKSTPAHFKSQLGIVDTTTYGQDISTVKHFLSNKGAGAYVGANNDWSLQAYSTDGGAAGMSFHRAGLGAVNFGLDPDNVIRFGGWSAPANIWTLDLGGNNTIAGNMTASSVYTNNWFRSTGTSGWYSETYGGGWHMLDTTWIRGYNGKSLWMGSGLIGGDGGLTVGYGGAGPNTTGGAIIAGNVGIGTIAPGRKLEIADDGMRIRSNGNWGVIDMDGTNSTKTLMIHYGGDNTNEFRFGRTADNFGGWEANPVRFDMDAPDGTFFMNGAGDIGIGTISPARKLDVTGGIRSTDGDVINYSAPTTYYQDTDHRSAMIHVNSNQFYILRGDGNNSTSWAPYGSYWPLQIDLETNNTLFGGNISAPAGNLTIANPSRIALTDFSFDAIEQGAGRTGNRYSYIDFHGDDTYTDFGLRVLRGNAGPNSWSEIYHAGTGDFNVGTLQAAPISFRTSSAERMRINANGNISIGTATNYPDIKVLIDHEDTNPNINSTNWSGIKAGQLTTFKSNPSSDMSIWQASTASHVEVPATNSRNNTLGMVGAAAYAWHRGSGRMGGPGTGLNEGVIGMFADGKILGTGSAKNVYGIKAQAGVDSTSASSTSTNAIGVFGEISNVGAGGNITNAYGLMSSFYIPNGRRPVNGYGLYLGALPADNPWSIYSTDASATMYHAGKVNIGSTGMQPAALAQVRGTTTAISPVMGESPYGGNPIGLWNELYVAPTSNSSIGYSAGLNWASTKNNYNVSVMLGNMDTVFHEGGGVIDSAVGSDASVSNMGGGAITTAVGGQGAVSLIGAGNINDARALNTFVQDIGAGTINNGYGLFVGPIQASNPWSIYSTDARANMYHAGKVSIGSTNIYPDIKVYVEHEDTSPTVGTPNIYGVKSNQMNIFYSNPSTDMSIWQGGTISIMEVKEGNTSNNTLGQTAVTGFSNHKGSGRIGQVIGINSQSTLMGPGNAFRLTGLEARAWVNTTSPSARADEAMAVLATIDNLGAGGGNITNAYGVYAQITSSNGRPATNGYGLYMGQINTTNNRYSIYTTDGLATSFFQAGIGIGMLNNPWSGYSLMTSQSIYTPYVYQYSDRRLKTNLVPLDNSLENILSLTGYAFDWKSDGKHSMGVIAQDVQNVFPNIVRDVKTGTGESILSVDYSALTAPIIESIKILANEDNKSDALDIVQDENIAQLKKQNELLKAQNEKLSQDIEQIKKLLKDNY